MGTRHLTIVKKDSEYKVAQYGQWDGYPEYTGVKILDFCRSHLASDAGRSTFGQKIAMCRFLSDAELDAIYEQIARDGLNELGKDYEPLWVKRYPALTRDTGWEILKMILRSENGLELKNNIDFVGDGVWCEWAWMIDLDHDELVAFQGFNAEPLCEGEEFYEIDKEQNAHEKFHAAKFVAKWSLDELPTDDDFLDAFTRECDEQ